MSEPYTARLDFRFVGITVEDESKEDAKAKAQVALNEMCEVAKRYGFTDVEINAEKVER